MSLGVCAFRDAHPAALAEERSVQVAQAQPSARSGSSSPSGKPNSIVIWGDDIGQSNLSTFTDGMLGYPTPNIDRIANEGMSSPTTTPSRAARRGVRRSSPARPSFAPA